MASVEKNYLLIIHVLFITVYCEDSDPDVVVNTRKTCSFFGPGRFSQPESSLVNCTWYATNSCCRRTEVTSVFGGMYPLHKATEACKNKLNYMMCYFCSPEQHLWYNTKARVCAEFCNTLYEDCQGAEYKGKEITKEYPNGAAFCDAQDFEVVEGKHGCFNFDPTPFGGTTTLCCSIVLIFTALTVSLQHLLQLVGT